MANQIISWKIKKMDNTALVKFENELTPKVSLLIQDQQSYDPFEDNQYLEQGTFLLSRFDKAKKMVEDQRLVFSKPLNESIKWVNSFFRNFSEPIEIADRELRNKLAIHRKQLEAEKLEEQIDAYENDLPEVQSLNKKIGGVVVKKVWTFKVIDGSQIPVQYMAIDSVKIRAAIHSGARQIPGISIYQTEQVSL